MSTIQLLRKATLLIDRLAQVGPASPAELAKMLDEPRPSVYRLIDSLENEGYVRSVDDGRYELGAMILRLGDSAVESLVNRDGLRDRLSWVREQLNMSAFFCVLRDDGIICLDRVDGNDIDLLYLTPGRTLPLHRGAVSEVLFGRGPEGGAALEGLPTDMDVSVSTVVADPLSSVVAFDDGGLAAGVATVAVPVMSPGGELMGAVAVAGLSGNVMSRKEAAEGVLVQAALAIAELGSGEPDLRASQKDGDIREKAEGIGSPVSSEVSRSPSVIAKVGALMRTMETVKSATSSYLAEVLREPGSSVYRMIGTLMQAGWVEQSSTRGVYRVGVKMLALAESLQGRLDIRKLAVPVMREIHGRTGETTFLCIRHGSRAVCIERIDGVRINSRVLQLGKSLPLHAGAAPRVLLAFAGRSAWEDYASGAGEGEGVWREVSSRAELFRELESSVSQGYVLSDNNVTPGIAAVGAPVFDHRGAVVASLSVSGLRDGIIAEHGDRPRVADLVRKGAAELSAALGAETH